MGNTGISKNLIISSFSTKILLSLSTSLLLFLCFPNYNQGWLVWLALVPLIIACSSGGILSSSILGLLSGTISAFGTFIWIFEVSGFRWYHFLILGCYLGLYTALWCGGLAILKRCRYISIFTIPALWCSLDFLKAHAGFLSFPWASLAHSQHDNLPLIQLASYTGEYGITFLIVMINYAIAATVLYRKLLFLTLPVMLIVLVNLFGIELLKEDDGDRQLKICVVQPNILRNERKTIEGLDGSIERLITLTRSVAKDHPSLIVWPETALKKLGTDPNLCAEIQTLSQVVQAPIITGSSDIEKFTERVEHQDSVQFKNDIYNSAYLITSDGPLLDPYRKRLLVPFSEYKPQLPLTEWPGWLVSESFNVIPGNTFKHFQITGGYRVSPIICWENLFADFIVELAREGSNLIVQLTNDNRFGETAAPYQHNTASIFRAVENRIPVVIASNTGPSQFIDRFGRIVAEIPYLKEDGVTTASLMIRQEKTFYTTYGDLFAKGCMLITIIGLAYSFTRPKSGKSGYSIFSTEDVI